LMPFRLSSARIFQDGTGQAPVPSWICPQPSRHSFSFAIVSSSCRAKTNSSGGTSKDVSLLFPNVGLG
jgi:hypothetical protein